jgi:hydrogenase maturation protein HypF
MSSPSLIGAELRAVRVRIAGRVQGLGVRPASARLASRLGVSGSVANTAEGVVLELMGTHASIEEYLAAYAAALPAGACVESMQIEAIAPLTHRGFRFAESKCVGGVATSVPCDIVACPECLSEVRDPRARRYRYAFTSCTACGPRYSIVAAMPYDRPATTMRRFALCRHCDDEYRDSEDRRFHAQTIACSECGPRVWFVDDTGQAVGDHAALDAAAAWLLEGRIVALKGLGGYQLLADATSTEAVRRLRRRKHRPVKPLAVLVGSLGEAARLASLCAAAERLLSDRTGPIVVVRRRDDALLSSEVTAGLRSVGIMLPTTPLHALLCDLVQRPLVCTSGNREGEPLVYEQQAAETTLRGLADAWLHHDRPILRPIDDSVVRVIDGEPCFLRLARGHAPLVLPWARVNRTSLIALGGEQKSAVALANGAQAVLGPHIGDLTSASVCERWEEQMESLARLYGIESNEASFVHDLHPEYFSTQWAARFPRRLGVQHHHAHIAAVMLEHGALDRAVLGLAWDGTGYGEDHTIWGGECLIATSRNYRRVAWLRPFTLLGGEQAVREPWRVAVALVRDALGPQAAMQLHWPEVSPEQIQAAVELACKPHLSPRTSSMGRLFDGVAALTLGVSQALDEGRPAMLLEDACDCAASGQYSFAAREDNSASDWRPVVSAIVNDLQRNVNPGVIAMRFHRAVANLAIAQANADPQLPLVTGGGVFQNAVLMELMAVGLSARRAGWLRPRALPPGDGGLAAGQLAVAAARENNSKD